MTTILDSILLADNIAMVGTRSEQESGGGMDAVSDTLRGFEQTENISKRESIKMKTKNKKGRCWNVARSRRSHEKVKKRVCLAPGLR